MLTIVGMMRLVVVGILLLGSFGARAEAAPDVHVCMDGTSGIDDAERAAHVAQLRRTLAEAAPEVKTIDVAVTKLSIVIGDDKVLVSAEVKVVVSTRDDQIKSFGVGTATFTVARRHYRPERAGALRHQVLGDALDGVQRRRRAAYRRVA